MDRNMWAFITEISSKKTILKTEILLCVPYGSSHVTGEAAVSLLYFTIAFIKPAARVAKLV
jgi:hypothetical protein